MNNRQTKQGITRGAFPDAQNQSAFYLFKNVSSLRATYQVRLLSFLAAETGKKLVINVPERFKPHPSLSQFMAELPGVIKIEKTSR